MVSKTFLFRYDEKKKQDRIDLYYPDGTLFLHSERESFSRHPIVHFLNEESKDVAVLSKRTSIFGSSVKVERKGHHVATLTKKGSKIRLKGFGWSLSYDEAIWQYTIMCDTLRVAAFHFEDGMVRVTVEYGFDDITVLALAFAVINVI